VHANVDECIATLRRAIDAFGPRKIPKIRHVAPISQAPRWGQRAFIGRGIQPGGPTFSPPISGSSWAHKRAKIA
jgi:hypothetical protein